MDASQLSIFINQAILFCFGTFFVIAIFMAVPLYKLLDQSSRTLGATENLINTLDKELGPTLREVDNVLVSVQEIKALAERGISGVGTKVEDVTGSIGKVTEQAKSQSSIWSTGLMTGLKAYISGNSENQEDDADKKSKK